MNVDEPNNATARTHALAVMEEVPVDVTGVVEFQAGGNGIRAIAPYPARPRPPQ